MVPGMTSDSILMTVAGVTSPVHSCLAVHVPIEAVSGVGSVILGSTAAVGIVVGALVALIIGWLVFRQCLGKVRRLLYVLCNETALI